ncbi:MAG: AAA family ATPase [Thermocrinis sp.]|jgi:type II secretory pathway predicted ATPase ExeA|uniref:AAA family ATPase n=1 Tax=Thermocrinis sp. TaxID=2024383 RepID=UPI003C0B6E7A
MTYATHTEQVLIATIQALRRLRAEHAIPLHALIWGKWGTGKTVSAQKIAKCEPDVFYVKVPDGEITRGRLYRLIGFSLGCGARVNSEATLDLIKHHILYYNLKPILIFDEAQRLLRKTNVLNELKDLAEDQDLAFSYVFLGDQTTPKLFAAYDHSLFKRFAIRKELQPLTEDTTAHLLKEYQIPAAPAPIFNFAKQRGWTTLDLAIVLQALKNQKSEPTTEVLEKLAKALGR